MPPEHHETRPSAEIVCVEGEKCRSDYCVLAWSSATLCGDRACRGREMHVRLRFCPVARKTVRHEMQVRLRFGLVTLHFWRKSRTKRWFWRLGASLLEEVSYETLVLDTWLCFWRKSRLGASLGGSLVRNAGFGDLSLHFRSFWRLGASLLEEVSYETLVLETWRFTWRKSRTKRWFWRLVASLLEEVKTWLPLRISTSLTATTMDAQWNQYYWQQYTPSHTYGPMSHAIRTHQSRQHNPFVSPSCWSLCPSWLPSLSLCLPSCLPSCWSVCPPSLPSVLYLQSCLTSCGPRSNYNHTDHHTATRLGLARRRRRGPVFSGRRQLRGNLWPNIFAIKRGCLASRSRGCGSRYSGTCPRAHALCTCSYPL